MTTTATRPEVGGAEHGNDAWVELGCTARRPSAERLGELLEAAGALAVTMTDAGDDPVLEPAPGASPLWPATRVRALFRADADIEAVRRRIGRDADPALAGLVWSTSRVADRDWASSGQDRFGPTRFGKRLWIVPTWCEPPSGARHVVRLDPGLAFGTGAHPTTALCLDWLDGVDPHGASLVDYGCGSGVLAIAALVLGARRVAAVDIDPQALAATRDNARANGVDDRLVVGLPDVLPGAPADLLVANILAGPLADLAPGLLAAVRPGGALALSGLLSGQEDAVRAAFGGRVRWDVPATRDGWLALTGTVRGEDA